MLRFGTDGVRGVALTELTPDYVESLGAAAARVLGSGTWLIGRDTRESGPELEAALVRGLRAEGASAVLCGDVPTPAIALFSADRQAPAVMITASHNPFSDNGIKIFAPGGLKLSDAVESDIETALESGQRDKDRQAAPRPDTAEPDPEVTHMADGVQRYVEHLVDMFPTDALAGLRVVLDCANGAMSSAAPMAVRALAADVIVIHAEPNGANINHQCGATDTASLVEAVLAHQADVGLAFDGDGDRVIAIDNVGNVVDGDRLIALAALQLQSEGQLTADTVVVTVMSNIGFHRAMHAAGITVVATDVGDRYVLEALDAGDFAIGGEQSGHVIYRHLATTGDGLLAGLRLMRHVCEASGSLAELATAVMITYPQLLTNIEVSERHPNIAAELADEIAAAEAELGDDGRVLLRASGTEPLIRVMVEAATHETARRVAQRLAEVVRVRFAR